MKISLYMLAAGIGLMCASCGNKPAASVPPASRPSPTIAAAPFATSARTPTAHMVIQPAAPTAANMTDANAPTTVATAFAYLWPAYFPDGMRIAPNESRVAREDEIGTTGTGFYLVTLNGGGRKLVVGGGATDALPLVGDTRDVAYDNGTAKLTTHGTARQLVFIHNRAKFFVYSSSLSEQELMLVAESMVPIDIAALRAQVSSAKQ